MTIHTTRRQFLETLGGAALVLGSQGMCAPLQENSRPRSALLRKLPASVKLVFEFNPDAFLQPEASIWPGYFWLWNAGLDPDLLRAQLRDMAAHDARSVCIVPMPHAFRPDSTNNGLDPDYLTPEYFERISTAVDEAGRLGMAWWLYDEGGWPSGQALGKVVEGHPELRRHTIVRERVSSDQLYTVPADALGLYLEEPIRKVLRPGDSWKPTTPGQSAYLYRIRVGGPVDLLNPAATARFVGVTHEKYASALKRYFGRTIRFLFTDEPAAGMPQPPRGLPWFPGIEAAYKTLSGRDFCTDLPHFFLEPDAQMPVETARARVALYDTVTRRFVSAYFTQLKEWARSHGLASGGHLGGEDETLGAIKHSFGHLLRPLREMDVPGVDLIWRQLFPGRERQSHFPIAAASAAHQNGTRFAFSESFCVYGNGLTPAQMKWLTDYQYLRGINLFVIGCYPLSTRDHHMTGERPHFGPVNPLWDHLAGYHAYVARLGYLLSIGEPMIRTALYYPARDLWAWGPAARRAIASYEGAAQELMATQCPFDLIDDDMLAVAKVEKRGLAVGAMRYGAVVLGSVQWVHPQALRTLEQFATAGGTVVCIDQLPGEEGAPVERLSTVFTKVTISDLARVVKPLIGFQPGCRGLRVMRRHLKSHEILVVFNEGTTTYRGSMEAAGGQATEMDPMTGAMVRCGVDKGRIHLDLEPGQTKSYLFSRTRPKSAMEERTARELITIPLEDIRAMSGRQFIAGEHDFETRQLQFEPLPLPQSAVWSTWLGEDFSGEIDYEFPLNVPADWGASPLEVETGPVEYAATVFVDGQKVGNLLWPPWRITLPPCRPGSHRVTIRVANALANELTSERVKRAWAERKGPGWPSPYHKRALEFETESRKGGLTGPVRVFRLVAMSGSRGL